MAKLTPMKAIRKKCLDCCCNQQVEVKTCSSEKCPLHAYRMGKRPKDDNFPVEAEKSLKTPT